MNACMRTERMSRQAIRRRYTKETVKKNHPRRRKEEKKNEQQQRGATINAANCNRYDHFVNGYRQVKITNWQLQHADIKRASHSAAIMKTRVLIYSFIKSLCVLLCGSFVQADWPLDKAQTQIVKKVVVECLERDTYSCFAEKLAKAVDNGMDWDIPIFDGITLKRNDFKVVENATSRSLAGVDQLYAIVTKFLDAHTLTVDFSEARTLEDVEFRDGGGKRKRIGKRERKYVQYALFVLLGIFGLTAPLILKTLGIIAGKALISSKIALIMLGSIALKKIFQADQHSPVKVHTHTIPYHEDDHDRYDNGGGYNYKYYTKSPLNLL